MATSIELGEVVCGGSVGRRFITGKTEGFISESYEAGAASLSIGVRQVSDAPLEWHHRVESSYPGDSGGVIFNNELATMVIQSVLLADRHTAAESPDQFTIEPHAA